MRVQETAMRPALRGGGWSKQTRVRDLGTAETMPAGAAEVDPEAAVTDWTTTDSEPAAPKTYAGQSAATSAVSPAPPAAAVNPVASVKPAAN